MTVGGRKTAAHLRPPEVCDRTGSYIGECLTGMVG